MNRRYVLIDTRKTKRGMIKAEHVDVLPEGISREEAINRLDDAWNHLTGREKIHAEIELAYLAMEGEDPVIDNTFLNTQGIDTLESFTPVARRRIND